MKLRKRTTLHRNPSEAFTSTFLILILFLLFGMVSGCLFALHSKDNSFFTTMSKSLQEIVVSGIEEYPLRKTYLNYVKYVLAVFFLGFTVLGIAGIPLTVFAKGFFLSLSVSGVIQTFGRKAIIIALSMFGLQALFSIPCILAASCVALETSFSLSKLITLKRPQQGKRTISIKMYIFFFIVLSFLLFIPALLDTILTPKLALIALKMFSER